MNIAVTNLDDMTQRNAALVEEAAAASRALQEQAADLMAHVNFFVVQEAGDKPGNGASVAIVSPHKAETKRSEDTDVALAA